jgi:RNA polymerase sigma factor (sigma-70 family)
MRTAISSSQDMVCQGEVKQHWLIENHLDLVARIARRYYRRYQGYGLVDLDDLVQEGSFGLLLAAEKFDDAKGAQFATYASWWIRKMITLAIATQTRAIRLPTHIWEELKHLTKAQGLLWQQHER